MVLLLLGHVLVCHGVLTPAAEGGRVEMVPDSSPLSLRKDRSTFGKLNMSKPTSATSERKVSFFGKR